MSSLKPAHTKFGDGARRLRASVDAARAVDVLGGDVATALRDMVRQIVREELTSALAAVSSQGDGYLPVADAARLASVATGTIRRWIREGRLAGYRAGRLLRVRRGELDELLASARPPRSVPTPEPSPEALARRAFARGTQ